MSREKEEDKKQHKKDKQLHQKSESNSSVISMKKALKKIARRKRLDAKQQKQSVNPEIERLRQGKLRNWINSIGIIVTLLSGFLVYDHYMTSMRIEEANTKIKTDIIWMRQIDRAIINMRRHENQARDRHQQGEKVNIKQLNVDRIQYQAEVADAYTGVNNVADENIKNSAELFNQFDESVPNILAKHAPSDSVWLYYLTRNNFLFHLEIQKENAVIHYEQQFILIRFFENTKILIEKLL